MVAAFITPKLPITQVEAEVKKPLGDVQNKTDVKKPPLAQPESETDFEKFVFESLHQTVESGGLFLEEEESKQDTIKRCPPG